MLLRRELCGNCRAACSSSRLPPLCQPQPDALPLSLPEEPVLPGTTPLPRDAVSLAGPEAGAGAPWQLSGDSLPAQQQHAGQMVGAAVSAATEGESQPSGTSLGVAADVSGDSIGGGTAKDSCVDAAQQLRRAGANDPTISTQSERPFTREPQGRYRKEACAGVSDISRP